MIKKILLFLLLILVAAGLYVQFSHLPDPLAPELKSSAWLKPGLYDVDYFDIELIDTTRPTQANGDFAGSEERRLQTRIWFPENMTATAPLVIYSHGFMSMRTGGSYLAEHLASHGYIVASMDYPLTKMAAPGGPLVSDVVNQPSDISFLIDQLLTWNAEPDNQFFEHVDENRIGVMGLSLGGMTSTLAAFHPARADLRIAAAISIAGPVFVFAPSFYESRDLPFMMIASPIDAMIDYDSNAATILERVKGAVVVTMDKASHTGFSAPARYLRWLNNADSLGCGIVTRGLQNNTDDDWTGELGSAEQGILTVQQAGLCTVDPLPEAMNPLRQHWLTTLAVHSFFESRFALSELRRREANNYLLNTLAKEIQEIRVQKVSK
jgi:pimeloyl-ACP methyl ester carboxylesterase